MIKTRIYPLTYNGAAMFAIWDRYGRDALNLLQQFTPEGRRCLIGATLIMAEQGELLRRYYGYQATEMLAAKDVEALQSLTEQLQLRAAILEQIVEDTHRSVTGEWHDIDLGLLELQRKKKQDSEKAYYLRAGLLCGLNARETMLLPVGTVYDLLELYVQANTSKGE